MWVERFNLVLTVTRDFVIFPLVVQCWLVLFYVFDFFFVDWFHLFRLFEEYGFAGLFSPEHVVAVETDWWLLRDVVVSLDGGFKCF